MNKANLEHLKQHNYHALLLVQSPSCDVDGFILEYFESILQNKVLDVNIQTQAINKLHHEQYCDLLMFDGSKESIKKEDILTIQNQFMRAGLESANCKFYVLKNFEQATAQAVNSLLKFLEEPVENVYCIITCSNEYKLLPTIVSRCEKIRLVTDWNAVNAVLHEYQLQSWQQTTYPHSFTNLTDLKTYLNSEEFTLLDNWLAVMLQSQIGVRELKNLQDTFKTFSYSQINFLLTCLINLGNNIQKIKFLKLSEDLIYNPNKTLLFNQIIQIFKE